MKPARSAPARLNSASSQPGQPLTLNALSLKDLVLGDALLTSSRCLRFAASTAEGVGARRSLTFVERKAMADALTRVEALWYLLRRTAAQDLAVTGMGRMRALADRLPSGSATGRAAKELLEQTSVAEQRAALRAVIDQWSPRGGLRHLDHRDRDHLLVHLGDDARAWQAAVDQLEEQGQAPICDALKRAYRRARRRLKAELKMPARDADALAELARCCGRVTAQLELLRPALSDDQCKQLWYLQRLTRNLWRRRDLALFEQRVDGERARSEARRRSLELVRLAVERRQAVQAQRTAKLFELALSDKPGRYLAAIVVRLERYGERLSLEDRGLELVDSTAAGDPLNLGDITVEERI